jgi:hypothetical protein
MPGSSRRSRCIDRLRSWGGLHPGPVRSERPLSGRRPGSSCRRHPERQSRTGLCGRRETHRFGTIRRNGPAKSHGAEDRECPPSPPPSDWSGRASEQVVHPDDEPPTGDDTNGNERPDKNRKDEEGQRFAPFLTRFQGFWVHFEVFGAVGRSRSNGLRVSTVPTIARGGSREKERGRVSTERGRSA